MEFRNHHVWVKQRLGTFSGRPVALALLVLVMLLLIPVIVTVALVVLSIALIVTAARLLLGAIAPSKPLPRAGDAPPTVIDVEVTRSETKP